MKRTLPLIVFLFLGCLLISAQEPRKEVPPVTVRVNLLVTDKDGLPIKNVTADRIQIWEDDVPQEIKKLEAVDAPLVIQLAIDSSGSVRSAFGPINATAVALVQHLAPTDQVQLFRFISSDKLERVVERTANKESIIKAIRGNYVEGGHSAVIDALYLFLEDFEKTPASGPERRAIVLFTDGEDRSSFYKQEQLFTLMQKVDVPILVIAPRGVREVAEMKVEKADKFLNQIALMSGGTVYRVKSLEDYSAAITSVFYELKSNYVVTYNSTNPKMDGRPRKMRVEVKPQSPEEKYRVAFRPGYSTPKN